MSKALHYLKEYKMLLVVFLIIVVTSIITPYFMTGENLLNILIQFSTAGIMACGMTFVILNGEFDLSIGSTLSLCGLLAIILEPAMGQGMAIAAALGIGGLVGLLNGILIAKAKISSFIVTIGTQFMIQGIALKVSGGTPVISQNPWFSQIGNGTIFGIPNLTFFLVATILVSAYCLYKTRFGRNIYVVGGNPEVAHNSGINVDYYKIICFVISGLAAALAGILISSRLNSGSALYGQNAALSCIAGVVIGGTSLSGGIGNVAKSIIGALIFTLISDSLDLMRVFSYYQTAITGILLILIIGIDSYSTYRAKA
jgi:ribose transport system permease protein